MRTPTYSPLTAELRALLHGAAEAREEWHNASAALSGVVSLLSETYPRPLYFDGVDAEWEGVDEGLAGLSGTPFYHQVHENREAARELWRMWEREGHTDSLHELVDAYLDGLTAESLAVRHYPATPPVHTATPPVMERRSRIAGGM
jgi:hypothetical protein